MNVQAKTVRWHSESHKDFLAEEYVGHDDPESGTPHVLEEELPVQWLHLPVDGQHAPEDVVTKVHHDAVHACTRNTPKNV